MKCYLCGKAKLDLRSKQLRHGRGNVYYCQRCDLAQLDVKSAPDLKNYYATTYRKTHGPYLGKLSNPKLLFDAYRNYQHDRIRLVERWLKPSTRLLDFACSAGQFLYAVLQNVR